MNLVDLCRNYQPLVFSLGLRGVFAGATLLTTTLLSRLLGSDGFGVYATILSLTLLVAGLAQAGSAQLLVREVPIAGSARNARRLTAITIGLILAFAVLLFAAAALLDPKTTSQAPMQIALIVLLTVILTASSATIRGFKHVLAGQMADTLIRPLILLGILMVFMWAAQAFDFRQALWFYVASLAAALLGNCVMLFVITVRSGADHAAAQPMTIRQVGKDLLGLGLLGWFSAINIHLPAYLAGTLAAPEQAGLLRVAMQFAAILTMGLIAADQAQGPHYSKVYKDGGRREIHGLLQRSWRFSLAIAIPSASLLYLASDWLIASFFDPDFQAASTSIQILALGTMAHALTGNVGLLLVAAKAEKSLNYITIVSVLLMLICCYTMIPTLGATGAAISATVSVVFRNIMYAMLAWKKFRVIALPFSALPSDQHVRH